MKDNGAWKFLQNGSELQYLSYLKYTQVILGMSGNPYIFMHHIYLGTDLLLLNLTVGFFPELHFKQCKSNPAFVALPLFLSMCLL